MDVNIDEILAILGAKEVEITKLRGQLQLVKAELANLQNEQKTREGKKDE